MGWRQNGPADVTKAPSVGYFAGQNSNQNKHKHTQKFSAKIVFQKLKAQTEASDISSCQDQAREERVEIDRPVGLDRSVLSNSSDNFENERTKVLYMKVCRDNFLL